MRDERRIAGITSCAVHQPERSSRLTSVLRPMTMQTRWMPMPAMISAYRPPSCPPCSIHQKMKLEISVCDVMHKDNLCQISRLLLAKCLWQSKHTSECLLQYADHWMMLQCAIHVHHCHMSRQRGNINLITVCCKFRHCPARLSHANKPQAEWQTQPTLAAGGSFG